MHFPFLSAILLAPVIGVLAMIFVPKDEHKLIKMLAAVATFVSLALTLYVYFAYDKSLGGMQFLEDMVWTKDLGVKYSLGVDGISLPMLLLTTLIGFASIFSSWNVDNRPKEFFILLLLLITGVMGTFVARDLFIFLLFYEVVVIPIYIMVLIWGSTKRVAKEYAGMKLTIYLLIGSAFLLVGLIAMYVQAVDITGVRTFDMQALAKLGDPAIGFSENFQSWVFLLVLFGFGSLLSMFPFHSWSPDGYAGAPTAVSMIHAGVLKKIGGYGLIRIGLLMLPVGFHKWAWLIAVLATINVAYAAFIALAQKDMKYVVGYSSVSHMGYVLIGIAAASSVGINGAVANMFAHGVMSALFFAMIGFIYEKTHIRHIPDLGGLAHQIPRVATGFLMAGMASLGLPGLISFVPEFTIFVGAFDKFPALTVICVLGVVFTAVYVLRTLAYVLFGPRKEKYDFLQDAKGPELVPLLVLGFVLLVGGILPFLMMDMINSGVEPIISAIAAIGGLK